MHSSDNENMLIVVDISDTMQDYVSIQVDIDETKVKAAALVAQNVDIKRVIGKDTLMRCIDPQDDSDNELRELIIPALCYYTYTRCLRMFQGTFTDSGFMTETEAETRNTAKSVSNEMQSIAEAYMQEVIDFLDAETPNEGVADELEDKLTPQVRVFGGEENRASN